MNQNIKNNYTKILDSKLYNGFYYDYMLYKGECVNQTLSDIEGMAIADFSTFDITSGVLYSTVTWKDAINNGVEMKDIGLTGVDNGFIKFRKDRITNKQFLDLYLNSEYSIKSGDTRFFMTPVTGNTQMYSYPMYLVNDNGEKYISFKGGYYQGFFGLDGFDYQVLPNNYNKDYVFHFELRPRSDYEQGVDTVNHTHSANTGIFFFIGTRAENKFWPFYKTSDDAMKEFRKEDITSDGYMEGCGFSGESYIMKDNLALTNEGEWLLKENESKDDSNEYFVIGDGYFSVDVDEEDKDSIRPSVPKRIISGGKTYLNTYDFLPNAYCGCTDEPQPESGDTCSGCCTDGYFSDDYFVEKCPEDTNGKSIETGYVSESHTDIDFTGRSYDDSEGYKITETGYYEIETDNKFILFDRTPEGYTVDNWVEGTKVRLYGKKPLPNVNYFLLMDRTPTGYTVETIENYEKENEQSYDIYRDIRNNVFALRIREDGAIGYRYGVLTCDEENENHYEIIEEYSKPNIVKPDNWNTINIRFAVMNPSYDKCDNRTKKMKIMIYVNGFLVFISKPLDTLLFKSLDEAYQKQEGVPYNISLGGGSIGLMETILPNYYATPDYILPIERDFCGTFIGDIRSFKIYEGFINYSAIANYLS